MIDCYMREYKKPKRVPGNPDHEAQEIFAKQYEEFMLNKAPNVEVLFADAVHPDGRIWLD